MVQTIGPAYMRWTNEHGMQEQKPSRPENAATAVEWYRRAAEGRNKLGYFYLGRAYVYGWGGMKNEEEGLRFLKEARAAGEDLASIHITHVYATRGDVKSAALWGRTVHPLAYKALTMPSGLTVYDYFKKYNLSWCGPLPAPMEARPTSECDPGT